MSHLPSMYCEFCAGACFLDTADPYPPRHPDEEGILDTDEEPTQPNQPDDDTPTPEAKS